MKMRTTSHSLQHADQSRIRTALRTMVASCSLALALALPATEAAAQAVQAVQNSAVELKGDVKVERVLVEEGKERRVLEKPDTVVPGDKLVFSTSYNNVSKEVVKDFVVTNPLPQPIRLDAADAAVLDLSVDGGKSWGKLDALTLADGKGGQRPAGIDDVTHIRWTIAEVQPGTKGEVTYRGTVR